MHLCNVQCTSICAVRMCSVHKRYLHDVADDTYSGEYSKLQIPTTSEIQKSSD